ncbi:MAG: NAD(P)H-dependent oxidoreductase [Spirochaetia bacterium]
MYKLKIIATSTRPGRKSLLFSTWIREIAKEYPDFETEILDLAEINLPFLDEPNHPMLRQYVHQHTRDWSAMIDGADAFIIVTPEYNYGFTGVFKNAIDYLHHEWKYKPAGIVSYGGIAGGTRSVQLMKPVLTALSMMPLMEAVHIPFYTKSLDAEGKFVPTEQNIKAAQAMMASLVTWTGALKTMRQQQRTSS